MNNNKRQQKSGIGALLGESGIRSCPSGSMPNRLGIVSRRLGGFFSYWSDQAINGYFTAMHSAGVYSAIARTLHGDLGQVEAQLLVEG